MGINAVFSTPPSARFILDRLKTVDGQSSGLDADTLDGHSSEDFLTAGNFWPLAAPDGTRDNPSYSWSNAPNFGIYREASGGYQGISYSHGGVQSFLLRQDGIMGLNQPGSWKWHLRAANPAAKIGFGYATGRHNVEINATGTGSWTDIGGQDGFGWRIQRDGPTGVVHQLKALHDGTAVSPNICSSSDAATGVFWPAEEAELGMTCGGDEMLRVKRFVGSNTGRVSIAPWFSGRTIHLESWTNGTLIQFGSTGFRQLRDFTHLVPNTGICSIGDIDGAGGVITSTTLRIFSRVTPSNTIEMGKGRQMADYSGHLAGIHIGPLSGNEIDIYRQQDQDGIPSWTESGSLIKLRRGIANQSDPANESGRFFSCHDQADTELLAIDKFGTLLMRERVGAPSENPPTGYGRLWVFDDGTRPDLRFTSEDGSTFDLTGASAITWPLQAPLVKNAYGFAGGGTGFGYYTGSFRLDMYGSNWINFNPGGAGTQFLSRIIAQMPGQSASSCGLNVSMWGSSNVGFFSIDGSSFGCSAGGLEAWRVRNVWPAVQTLFADEVTTGIPSVASAGDMTTGLSWPGGGNLSILTGGTERARFLPTGGLLLTNGEPGDPAAALWIASTSSGFQNGPGNYIRVFRGGGHWAFDGDGRFRAWTRGVSVAGGSLVQGGIEREAQPSVGFYFPSGAVCTKAGGVQVTYASSDLFKMQPGRTGYPGLIQFMPHDGVLTGVEAMRINPTEVRVLVDLVTDSGLVLESPDTTRWRVTIDDSGSLVTSALP